MKMKVKLLCRIFLFALGLICGFISQGFAQIEGIQKPDIVIGMLLDGVPSQYEEEIGLFREELDLILGAAYTISLPDQYILNAYADTDSAEMSYERLVDEQEVDIVVVVGLLSGTVVGQKGSYPKPVIIFGVEDPVLQGITPAFRQTSGVHNLTYVVTTESFIRDLYVFRQFHSFNHLGVIVNPEMKDILPIRKEVLDTIPELSDVQLAIIPSAENVEATLEKVPDEVDAVFVGYNSNTISDVEMIQLIEGLTEKGLPTFTSNVDLVEDGALASNTPEPNTPKIVRRIVLNIEQILDGTDAAELPVMLDIKEKLAINVKTMNRLDIAPSYKVLSQAQLIDQFEYETDRKLSLIDVMQQAQQSNIELRAAAQGVRSQFKDVRIAESEFFPFGTAFATGALVDQKTVEFKQGEVSEFIANSILSIRQLIYSERAMGEITIQKHEFQSEGHTYESLKLDLILRTGEAYFEILRATNILRIAQDNWRLTQENRDLAVAREEVGYSDASDVFRWESNLRQATGTVIQAETNLELAKIRLNLLLNRPYNEEFKVEDAVSADSMMAVYFDQELIEYLYDPKSLSFFSDFLTVEGIRNSPDLKALDYQVLAQDRFLKVNRRTRYIPIVEFGTDFFFTIERGGLGTEAVVDPGTGITISPGFPPDFSYLISLSATLPFLQGGRLHHISQKVKIDINQLKEQRRVIIQNIQENVSASLLNATVNAYNLTLTQEAAEYSRKAYGMVKDSYSNGQSLFVDLLNAQNEVLLANLAAANAVYDYLISLLNVDRSISSFAILRTDQQEQAMQQRFENYFIQRVSPQRNR